MITKTASGVMMKPAGGLLIKLGIGSITKPGDGALTKPGSGLITKAASGVLTRPAGGVLTKSRGGAIAKPGDGALTKPGGGALVKAAGGAGARTAAPVSLSRKQEKEAANARLAEAVTRAEGAAANRRTAVSVQSAAGRTWSGGAPLRTVVAAPRPPAGCATGGGPRAPRRNCKAEAVAAARAQGAEHAGKLLQANGDAGGDAADTGDGETRAAAVEEEETARDASAEEKAEHDWSGQSKAERDESDTKAERDESEESKAERDESHVKAERDEIDESKAERDESHMKAERDEIDESKTERDESHMKAERDEIDESKTERDESHTKTKRDDCHMKAERDESGTKADHDESNESNMKAECGENGMKAEGDTKAERDESGTKAERDESDTKAEGDESGEMKAECNESHMKTEHDENGTKAEGDTKAERDESGTKADSGEMKAESDMREKIITLSDELGAPKAAFDLSEETKSTYKTGEKAACGSREEETVDVDASGGRTEAATCDLGGGAKTRCAGLGQAGATHRASEPTTAGFDAGQEMKTPGAATDDASDGVPPAADAAGAEAVCDVSVFPGAIPKLNGVGEAFPDARGAEDGSPLPRPSTKDAGSADTFGPRRLVSKTPAAVPSGLTDLGMSPVAEDKAAKGDDVLRAEAGARAGPGASLGDVRAAAPPRADVVRVQVHSHEHVGDAREGTGSDTEMKPAARAGVDENGALSRHVHGARFLAGAGPGVLLAELGLREINLSEASDEASSPSLPDGGGGGALGRRVIPGDGERGADVGGAPAGRRAVGLRGHAG
ncbi:uncharacterized protein LOC144719599 [Lampetra planeri]